MILSGAKIKECVKSGLLRIDPFAEGKLKDASYTFTLASKILELGDNQTLQVDVKPKYQESLISKDGYILRPGEFILGFTREKLTLNGNYVCLLSTRGSCAQMGLNVLLSSTLAEPDTDNVQTLEIANTSKLPIILFCEMPIVKGIFMEVEK